eukprot:g5088.t1
MASHISPCCPRVPYVAKRHMQLRATNRKSPVEFTEVDTSSKIENFTRRAVESVVKNPVFFDAVKSAAKSWMKFLADQNGIPWSKRVNQYNQEIQTLEVIKEATEDPSLVYPDYYLKTFHAYNEGNLCWLAAFEVESAFEILCLRSAPDSCKEAKEARALLSKRVLDCIQERARSKVSSILDIGCGVGISTINLARGFPEANITGIDLSPYFISFAKHTTPTDLKIDYRHMVGEKALDHFEPNSFDVVSLVYILHECPLEINQKLIKTAASLCRSGGMVVVLETNTKSTALRQLPLAIKALQQSTEPYLVEYLELDVPEILKKAQLNNVQEKIVSQRHAVWTGIKS